MRPPHDDRVKKGWTPCRMAQNEEVGLLENEPTWQKAENAMSRFIARYHQGHVALMPINILLICQIIKIIQVCYH